MTRMVSNLLFSFGSLLDLSFRGRTKARVRLDRKRLEISHQDDKSRILSDFVSVGADMSSAIKKYEHGQKKI